jgi:hypothetical protein
MVRFLILSNLLLFFFFSPVICQVPQVTLRSESSIQKHADLYFERHAYSHAAKLYHRLVISDPENKDIHLKLGDCYRNLREPAKAAYWYAQSLKIDRSSTEHFFHYASVLCASGKYQLAKYWYQAYLKLNPEDQRAKNALASLVEPQNLFDVRFEIKPLKIELQGKIFGPTIFDNGLVFVGEGNTGSLVKKITTWQEGPYFDLYFVPINDEGKAGFPKYLDDQLNSVFHEGPVVFFDQGNKVILTRSNFKRGQEDTRNLQLMIAERKPSGSWGSPRKLFHHPDYSIGHPAINQNGKVIYFASNKPGGFGGTDLYRSECRDGVWQEPINAGPIINTSGNELFPSLDEQGVLYFSSDGHGGLGGLEILKVNPHKIQKPINMGHPINSPGDDFGITWVPGENSGYFSTDRTGQDKIYQFKRSSQLVNAAVPSN